MAVDFALLEVNVGTFDLIGKRSVGGALFLNFI